MSEDLMNISAGTLDILLLSACVLFITGYYNRKLKKRYYHLKAENKVLATTVDELDSSLSFKNKLLQIIAHDVKGPVSSLLTYMELSDEKELKYYDQSSLKHAITVQLTTIHNLLGNMLQWSEQNEEQWGRDAEPFNIRSVVCENISLLDSYLRIKGIKVNNRIPHAMEMRGVRNEIDVVVRNLLFNAVKFTNEGGEINIFVKDDPTKFEIIVQDNGIGIPEQKMANLFTPMAPKASVGTMGERGTGLGLALCSELITRNGGTISAKSRKNDGSELIMEFPKGLLL